MSTPWDTAFECNEPRILAEWFELLRFPSISADPAHDHDCRACADWLATHLRGIGFDARLLATSGKPAVLAHREGKPGKPTVLIYGHYDVQPVDPLGAWNSPPFEPKLVQGRVCARGAEDNKGQLFYVLKALEALVKADALDAGVKILIEGEEECGSTSLTECMAAWANDLRADVLLVTDVMMDGPRRPTIILGLRGIIHLSLSLHGARHDLHSGVHGGVAPNPALALARLLTTLHDDNGRIVVDGFADGMQPPSEAELAMADTIPFDPGAYADATGVTPSGGERGVSPIVRLGLHPAIDANGIHSGFGGPGVKTIIPAMATAKLTARLAAGQDPRACLAALERHLRRHAPASLDLRIDDKGVGGPGLRLDPSSPWLRTAADVLRAQYGIEPVLRWEGASIPIVADLARVSGAAPVLVGFGLEEDCIHAPGESFALEQFRAGFRFTASWLAGL